MVFGKQLHAKISWNFGRYGLVSCSMVILESVLGTVKSFCNCDVETFGTANLLDQTGFLVKLHNSWMKSNVIRDSTMRHLLASFVRILILWHWLDWNFSFLQDVVPLELYWETEDHDSIDSYYAMTKRRRKLRISMKIGKLVWIKVERVGLLVKNAGKIESIGYIFEFNRNIVPW